MYFQGDMKSLNLSLIYFLLLALTPMPYLFLEQKKKLKTANVHKMLDSRVKFFAVY